MKISFKWLKEYIDYQGTAEELSVLLTKAGIEVDGVEEIGKDISQVIIGKVKTKAKHPDADTLSICTVFDGKEDLQIVCGAPNVAAGQTIALAPIGCTLPTKDGLGFKIKKSKIRGVESFGMICAEDELGLSDDHEGIMVLDSLLEAGQNFSDALGLSDTVLELSITANRADCNSYLGIATEVAAATGLALRQPTIELNLSQSFASNTFAAVTVQDEACPRYMGAAVRNVKIKPSPNWLKRALEASGVRSINNVVDITNYVMLETGNPLHAFDARDIEGQKIIVRKAQEGETIKTLDDQERKLLPSDLLICDNRKPIALAGVMGGANSEIKDDTANVFIEVAYFTPAVIRKTAKRLGLQTDSSYRFERGVDPNRIEYTMKRTLSLLRDLAEGTCSQDIQDLYKTPILPKTVSIRTSRANKLLGKEFTDEQIRNCLTSIRLEVIRSTTDVNEFKIPTVRHDLTREVDLIEEVARLIGFENIPYTTPRVAMKSLTANPIIAYTNQVKDIFSKSGFNETISFHFTGLKDIEYLQLKGSDPRSNPIGLKNPITEEHSHMQTSLIPNLLRAVEHNANHFNENLQIFEVGRIYLRPDHAEQFKETFHNKYYKIHEFVKDPTDRPIERSQVAGVITGKSHEKSWNQEEKDHDFYSVKGLLFAILSALKVPNAEVSPLREIDTYLHPGKACTISSGNTVLGVIGQISPSVAQAYNLKDAPFVFELDIASIMRVSEKKTQYKPISKFPAVSRDLSFAFKKDVTWIQIKSSIEKLNIKTLVSVKVFDLFEGGNLSVDQKSLAISLIFQSHEKTLEEQDTQKSVDKVVALFIKDFNAVQR